ncbi:MAG: two pore domain potassium channel family protein [Magnetococcales bacterium]|nr:two pore domain potassium channel family protein [Magnetococcales bacterium]
MDPRESIWRLLLALVILVVLHIAAMHLLENMAFGDALWLTLTTITTVGYGDLSAQTGLGRTITVILLYFGGVFILARVVSDYFDFRVKRRELMLRGLWRWHVNDHIVIINTPNNNAAQYLERLCREFRQTDRFARTPIQVLTTDFPSGLPAVFNELGVIHYTGNANDEQDLDAVNVSEAAHVVLLSRDSTDKSSDIHTFDTLHRLGERTLRGTILAECVDDRERERLTDAGANAVVRPIRAYPGMIVRTLVAPGAEFLFEDFFTSTGNKYTRYDVIVEREHLWSDIVCAFMQKNLGTAIGFIPADIDDDHAVVSNPSPTQQVRPRAIFMLACADRMPSKDQVQKTLRALHEGKGISCQTP